MKHPLIALVFLFPLIAQAIPTNVALNRPAVADSIYTPAYTPERAVDGDSTSDTSRWLSADSAFPHWIELELGQTYTLSQMKFWTGKNGQPPLPIYDFALQYWDGTGWTDIYAETGSTNTGAVDVNFGPTVSGNRVRLHATSGPDNIVRLFEIELYGEPHSLTYNSLSPALDETTVDHTGNIAITFNAPVSLVSASGIRVENLDTSTDLAGIGASVIGDQLLISHPGLAENTRYAVHVPAGAVALASNGTQLNGSITWTFETARFKPQLASYTNEIPGLTDDVELVFDRALNLVNPSGIRFERFSDGGAVSGTTPALSSDTLTLSHDPLVFEETYLVIIEAGSLEGVINGQPNDEIRGLVYAGSTVIFSTNFDTGLEGFQTGHTLGEIAGTSSNIYWRWFNSGTGPNYDSFYLASDTNYYDDFVLSPQVNFRAGRTYTIEFRASLARSLHVGVTPTANLSDVTEIALVSSGSNKPVQLEYTATDTAPGYFIFNTGETNNWQNQQLDTMTLTESVPPLVRINAPLIGSSYLESASIPVEIEAYGISGELTTLEIYDNDVLRASMAATESLYAYDWDYHAPGTHTLRVKVTDARGNVAEDEVTVTVTFDNGTLPAFLGYDFDDGPQGWTRSGDGTPVGLQSDPTGRPGQSIRFHQKGSDGVDFSSPQIFLLAGESYTVSFKSLSRSAATYTYAFLPTTEPGYPTNTAGAQSFSVTPGGWTTTNLPFTVPADGPYHLTFYLPVLSGYQEVNFDDIRLIGNFNSVPFVNLTVPSSSLRTLAGANVQLEAEASDTDGSIIEVSFRDGDGNLLAPDAMDSTDPFAYAWNDVPEGQYNVIARALDDRSATVDSASRAISVVPNNLTMSTYLGNSAIDENLTGAAYLSDGTLVLGGILDPALFPGVTPIYRNGAVPGDRGVIARLSEDGTTVLSVTVVGSAVFDIDTDGSDRIHVAAGSTGALVLNAAADTVLWSDNYTPALAHRIDAADGGTFAVLISPTTDYRESKLVSHSANPIYNGSFAQIGTVAGASAFTTDIAVDEGSQTVVVIGWKNITSMQDDSSGGSNPVDIPSMVGRAYNGTEKWRAYDWGKEDTGVRWLNLYTNNMADTRGARVIVHEGRVIAGIEFDGGNTPLRYDPFDLAISVNVVGGDQYHSMYNTSTVPKTFVGIYDADTGAYQNGQWITNRLDNGNDNTIRIETGNLMVDHAGRIHVVGSGAAGLPMTHEPLPGTYTGGGYHLVYSPDLESREFVTRLSVKGDNAAIALSPNGLVAIAGMTENDLFLKNEFQSTLTNVFDAYYTVGNYESYYNFQSAGHPRLFFDDAELAALRTRLDREPYASMYTELIAQRDSWDFYKPYDPSSPRSLFGRARGSAMIYSLSGEEAYALDAKSDIEAALVMIGEDWASPAEKGLTLYGYANALATAYDLCAGSPSWDAAFAFQMSKRLLEIATVIVESGGTQQPSDAGSNWRAIRGSSAGLALLATDHLFDPGLSASAHGMLLNYLNTNQGGGAARGWNPEGFGYTAYPLGSSAGPYAVAAGRADPSRDLRDDSRMEWMTWTGFVGSTTAYDIYGGGGVKTDWSDDNGHTLGEGIYGLAFYFADADMLPGMKHAYDRFMGALSPNGAKWDATRHGAFWSILFYPETIPSQDPTEIWNWHIGSDDSGGVGVFTFRDSYQSADDILIQFKARLRTLTQAHDGPDGLGFRVIGLGDAFVVGGGLNSPGKELNQATVYPASPDVDFTYNDNIATLVGTPLIKPDGGGHAIAQMGQSNVLTSNHKRWFVTDFDSATTGADATIIVADTSSNGLYWQLPTFLDNSIITSGNTFTITGTNGATLKGTILHPGGTPAITVGTKARGSAYTLENGGTLATEDPVTNPRITDNRYLFIQGNGDGDFLVAMTLMKTGPHPAVAYVRGGVADAVVQVGSRQYALQTDTVLYDGSTYAAPDATVTFDADGKGTLGGFPVQSVAYGGSAIAPVVSPDSGYTFMGWNKPFIQVVKSMTVTALYDAIASGFGSWIGDPLYGLALGNQDPDDDPDFDGIVNILEYALVLNPSIPDGGGVISVTEAGGNIILGYRVRDGATDITVTPKYSSTLAPASWIDIPSGNISISGTGPNYTEYEASMPIGSGPMFLTLKVENP